MRAKYEHDNRSLIGGLCLMVAAMLFVAPASFAGQGQYRIEIKPESPATVNKPAKAIIQILPRLEAGQRYHMGYPLKIELSSSSNDLRIHKRVLGRDDAILEGSGMGGAEFHATYTAQMAGSYTITAEMVFAICTLTECRSQQTTKTWTVSAR